MTISRTTHHLALKAAMQRLESAEAKEDAARAEYQRTGLASIKGKIEDAIISRQAAYYKIRDISTQLVEGRY